MARRTMAVTAVALSLSLLMGPGFVQAAGPDDVKSDNITEIGRAVIDRGGGEKADGSDLAFQGKLVIAGSYSGTAIFKIINKAPFVEQIGFHSCPGGQGDVSVYKNLVFVSLNGPQSADALGCADAQDSAGKAGVRILDISDPTSPRQIGFVELPCGSHTHTIYPVGRDVFIYNESYPLGVPSDTCSPVSHRKVPIVKVPLSDPSKAEIVNNLDVSPEIGCHDVTIFAQEKIAAAACIGESQIWDVADPAAPVILTRIYNPGIEIHHGVGFSWDGKVLVIADEFAGSVTGSCAGNANSPVGALWFYDITDRTLPIVQGYFNVPRYLPPETQDEFGYLACTSHNFNVLPMKDEGIYVASVGYRNSGLSVVDFSDPTAPKEIAYYLQLDEGMIPDVWAAYWYNGRIYANDNGAGRGLSVYEVEGLSSKEVHYFKGQMNPQVQVPSFK